MGSSLRSDRLPGPADAVACFAAGTRLATRAGDVAVEDLGEGDRLTTLVDGATGTVRWVGHRRLQPARHWHPMLVHPIRVAAGAFGKGLPRRDLLLSPEHAVFVDGALIPVRYLVNGVTITIELVHEIDYFHVELDRHDVVLAEGLPAESWLDTGNRHMFANAGAAVALFPDFTPETSARACAPMLTGGPAFVALEKRLARIARRGLQARKRQSTQTSTGFSNAPG